MQKHIPRRHRQIIPDHRITILKILGIVLNRFIHNPDGETNLTPKLTNTIITVWTVGSIHHSIHVKRIEYKAVLVLQVDPRRYYLYGVDHHEGSRDFGLDGQVLELGVGGICGQVCGGFF